jgi:hypothetical protein
MNKHTPGPWRLVGDRLKSPSGLTIADLRYAINDASPNSQLIAAAPELLDAAKTFIVWVDEVWGSAALSPKTLAEYEKAKLAIAKAEGGNHE